jgi:hypothetical protein
MVKEPKRSRPRDRDRKGPPNATGRKVREGGWSAGAPPKGKAPISASRETCQHAELKRADGVFRYLRTWVRRHPSRRRVIPLP